MIKKQSSFTCMMCETNIPMQKMSNHMKKDCPVIKYHGFDVIDNQTLNQLQKKQTKQYVHLNNKMGKKQAIKKKASQQERVLNYKNNIKKEKDKSGMFKQKFVQKKISKVGSNKQENNQKVQCLKCLKMIPFQKIDGHEFQCTYQLQCQFCGQIISVMNIQDHEKVCIIKKELQRQEKGQIFDFDPQIHDQNFYELKILGLKHRQPPYGLNPKKEAFTSINKNYGAQKIYNNQYKTAPPQYYYNVNNIFGADLSQQQQEWQHIQGIAQSFQNKPKKLSQSKLNSLPLVCYRKISQKSKRSKISPPTFEDQKLLKNSAQYQKLNKQKYEQTKTTQIANPQSSEHVNNHQLQKQQQQEQLCSICYQQFQQNDTVMKLRCLHFFHPDCVGKWFQNDSRCPLCKKQVI